MALPTNEFLLLIADICHNFLNSRKYDTIAVGAIGKNPFFTKMVLGINSSTYDETKLTKDRIVPPQIRSSPLVGTLDLHMTQEAYHAETSVLLYAKDSGMKIYGLASSRKICPICDAFLARHAYLLDVDCKPVDGWLVNGQRMTQSGRQSITRLDWQASKKAIAVREGNS